MDSSYPTHASDHKETPLAGQISRAPTGEDRLEDDTALPAHRAAGRLRA